VRVRPERLGPGTSRFRPSRRTVSRALSREHRRPSPAGFRPKRLTPTAGARPDASVACRSMRPTSYFVGGLRCRDPVATPCRIAARGCRHVGGERGAGQNARERDTGEQRDAGAAMRPASAGSRPGGYVATPGPQATTPVNATRANGGTRGRYRRAPCDHRGQAADAHRRGLACERSAAGSRPSGCVAHVATPGHWPQRP
jgi:hypothetical protein